MIGVFDSGLGGIQTLRYLVDEFPQYTYCYLGDTAGLPYGPKDPQWIHDRTFACCERLFDQGCHLVILACNSASTYAIRSRQDTYPEKKMLSVTVPGVEAVVDRGVHHVGILGTKATVESNLYPSFFARRFPNYIVTMEQVIGGNLVTLIEQGATTQEIDEECKKVCSQFSDQIEALILGCTHYPIILSSIKKNLPEGVFIIDPAKEAAHSLSRYLVNHPEVETKLDRGGSVFFNVSKDLASFHSVGSIIRGESFSTQVVEI